MVPPVGEEGEVAWIAAVIGVLLVGPLEGTWKVREPLRFALYGDQCEVRRGVAYLEQEGTQVTGSYEAEFSCWSPYAPAPEFAPRRGNVVGTLENGRFTARILIGDPSPIELDAVLADGRLIGTFRIGDGVSGEWAAARLGGLGEDRR